MKANDVPPRRVGRASTPSVSPTRSSTQIVTDELMTGRIRWQPPVSLRNCPTHALGVSHSHILATCVSARHQTLHACWTRRWRFRRGREQRPWVTTRVSVQKRGQENRLRALLIQIS